MMTTVIVTCDNSVLRRCHIPTHDTSQWTLNEGRTFFTIYALDLPEIDDAGTLMTWRKLRVIIRGHILGQASLASLRGH